MYLGLKWVLLLWYFTSMSVDSIDLFYNIADAINKIGFGLVIYSVAVAETAKAKKA